MLGAATGFGEEPAAEGNEGFPLGKHVFGSLRARDIGPAVMSGRISALDVQDNDPRLMYVGTGGGGVWRSRNGGIEFESVFDDHSQSRRPHVRAI